MKPAFWQPYTRYLSRSWVYTARSGLCKGMKRQGGYDFLPFRKLDIDAAFLAKLDYRGKIVYDIGAFEGLFSLFFARAVAEGQVISFEPVPRHRQLIEIHCHLNHIANVRLLRYAIGRQRTSAHILVCDEMGAYSTIHPTQQARLAARHHCQEVEIEVYGLDELVAQENLPWPDFIKIDVEGLEFDALRGMTQLIQNHHPDLFIELHGFDNAAIAEWLLARGYHLCQIPDGLAITRDNLPLAKRFLYATWPD